MEPHKRILISLTFVISRETIMRTCILKNWTILQSDFTEKAVDAEVRYINRMVSNNDSFHPF